LTNHSPYQEPAPAAASSSPAESPVYPKPWALHLAIIRAAIVPQRRYLLL
jgi:hypothetical protein